jgi:NDP-sugar pyrophosphorylase family protein
MMHTTNDDGRLYGIVLAAGKGKRLEPYVQEVRGKPLPKQYVNLIGNRPMLGNPEVILIASGSEVSLAVEAHEKLVAEGIRSRVVSMPS